MLPLHVLQPGNLMVIFSNNIHLNFFKQQIYSLGLKLRKNKIKSNTAVCQYPLIG